MNIQNFAYYTLVELLSTITFNPSLSMLAWWNVAFPRTPYEIDSINIFCKINFLDGAQITFHNLKSFQNLLQVVSGKTILSNLSTLFFIEMQKNV